MASTGLTVGDKAPEFSLPRDGGETVALSDYQGKQVVLFFYPRDDTSGCTKEAIGFSEHLDAFKAADAVVLGLSKDSITAHNKFRDKHGLRVALLSDETTDICEQYGTWVEKKMYGKTFMGIERSTFLIGADGHVVQIWRKVKVPGHVDEVLAAVTEKPNK